MVKKAVFILLAAFCGFASSAQTVGRYRYHKKNYFVYPLRIENEDELPLPGVPIPDGDYVVFHNYIFKQKKLFRRYHTVLHDTAKVVAYVSVKKGTLNGPATLYEYKSRHNYTLERSPRRVVSGIYTSGQRDSTWKFKSIRTGDYYTMEYQNDLPNGYHYSYNKKGVPESRMKYRSDTKVDTVTYYYADGRTERTYDLYADSARAVQDNIYTHALRFLNGLNIDNGPGTFYKKFDPKGNILLDLKYDRGQALPFDSASSNGASVKVLQGQDPERFKILYRGSLRKETVLIEDDYRGASHIKHLRQKYDKKGKLMVKEGYEIFPLDSTLDPNIPQLLVSESWSWGTDETFFIPRYKFAYQKSDRNGITSIDPKVPVIYTSDTTATSDGVLLVESASSMPQDSALKLTLAYNPFFEKAYITNEEFPLEIAQGDHYPGSDKLEEVKTEYTDHVGITRYLKDGAPLSGRVCLGPFSHGLRMRDSVMEIPTGFFNEFSKGSLLSGKKQGPWEELFSEHIFGKKHVKNIKAYFLSHPYQSTYTASSYKNGLLDGPSQIFTSIDMEDADDYFMEEEKEKKAAMLKKNLSKSKKYFVFKSVEKAFSNDSLDGPYKSYYSNTALQTEMFFLKGRPHGDYKRYNYDGVLLASGHFDQGKFEGPFYAYSEQMRVDTFKAAKSTLRLKAMFRNNLLTDTLFYYSDGSRPYMSFGLRNDTLQFKKQYFDDGRLQEDIVFTPQSTYAITENILESSNYFDIIYDKGDPELRKAEADYRSYYNNGQLLAEGKIAYGYPGGDWKFYNINGTLVHQINFTDTAIFLPGDAKAKDISGFYTGYYSNGKLRCRGYLENIELSYDCFVKQDKPNLDFYVMDFYDMSGNQMVRDGNGYLVKYDENGLRMAAGKLVSCREDSLWKYYTPEQKLTMIGNYVNRKKEGIWYEGDLEGINFEDGACFDQSNVFEMMEYERKRKEIRITKTVYVNGISEKRTNFSSDLNKTYAPRRRYRYSKF